VKGNAGEIDVAISAVDPRLELYPLPRYAGTLLRPVGPAARSFRQ
jgi:hypothetical protein